MDRLNGSKNQVIPTKASSNYENGNPTGSNRPLLFVLFVFFLFILAYITNFYSHEISNKPADWGALGDYIGGITNPLISTIALIYLAKAYYTQKAELAETRIALRDTAKHSEDSARAQAKLVDSAIKQEMLTKKNLELKFLTTQLSLHQNKIAFLHNELSNSTYNYNKFKSTLDIFSTKRESWLVKGGEMDSYRFRLISLIEKENIEINGINIKIKDLVDPKAAPENCQKNPTL